MTDGPIQYVHMLVLFSSKNNRQNQGWYDLTEQFVPDYFVFNLICYESQKTAYFDWFSIISQSKNTKK